MATSYEWVVESLDDYDDITDTCAWSSCMDARAHMGRATERGERTALCLVRNVGNDVEGLTGRQWAYVDNGALPATFDGGAVIPARYRVEFAQC